MSSKQNMKEQTEALTPSKSIASHKEMKNQIEKPSKTWDPQNFSTKTTLAKGTYSTIHLVQSSHTKKLYAVKARNKSLIEQNSETKFIHTEKDVVLLAKRENHPFILLDKEYDTAVDWWQLGIMTYQMLTQSSPFKGEDQDDVFDSILSDEVAFPEFVMGESIIFVKGLMEKEPDKRLGSGGNGAEEVMAHAFFDGIDWDDIYNKRVEVPFVPGLRDLVGISQGRSAFSHSKMEMVAGQVEELIPEAQDLFGGFGFSVD
ncbi:hypothetical protein Vi05172_g8380 [Venturia inaequalis]|nr:hypothetical protein Vi05172_g8380 [Venturia inaequalis]